MFNTSKTIISNKMQGFCFLFFFFLKSEEELMK